MSEEKLNLLQLSACGMVPAPQTHLSSLPPPEFSRTNPKIIEAGEGRDAVLQ